MTTRCYRLRLSDEPNDVVLVRLDVTAGEPTEADLDELTEYFRHLRDVVARNHAEEQGR